jgi:glyoxylase-like metal-dependent hydrolase (beta-lactamase superfamily II)
MKTTRLRFGLNVALALMLCSLAACAAAGVAPSPSSRSISSAVTKTPHATALLTSPQTPTPLPSTPRQPPPTSAPLTLTIVYDNNPFDARLKTAWGFACLIETGDTAILFDTSADGPTLMSNLAVLGFDPRDVDIVVLSHFHSDHTGGLDTLVSANDRLTVYLPQSFPTEYKARIHNPVVEVRDSVTITDRIRTTGELGAVIIEQSLIVETDQGLIVVTGCAHPGVVEIVRRAKEYGDVYLEQIANQVMA